MRKYSCIDINTRERRFRHGQLPSPPQAEGDCLRKHRRNKHILEKFYDAKYMDVRDGRVKKGQELSCGRTKRCELRHSEKDLRPFRGHRVSRVRRAVRKERYSIRPGTVLLYQGKKYKARGVHNKGTHICLENGKSIPIKSSKSHIVPWSMGTHLIVRKERAGQQLPS